MTKNQKKKQLNKYLALTGIAFQMGITIYLGVYFGKKLDIYFESNKKLFTLFGTLVGLIVSLWSVIAQLKRMNE